MSISSDLGSCTTDAAAHPATHSSSPGRGMWLVITKLKLAQLQQDTNDIQGAHTLKRIHVAKTCRHICTLHNLCVDLPTRAIRHRHSHLTGRFLTFQHRNPTRTQVHEEMLKHCAQQVCTNYQACDSLAVHEPLLPMLCSQYCECHSTSAPMLAAVSCQVWPPCRNKLGTRCDCTVLQL